MTNDPRHAENIAAHGASRPARELFCIHSYAGEAGPPCGWRGRESDARWDLAGHQRCPRCGRMTLLPLPSG